MTQSTRYIGLDVHSKTIAIAVAEESREPATFLKEIPNDLPKLLKVLESLGSPTDLSCVNEAGPTGYGLYRKLLQRGIDCEVIAPSKMPRASGDRVKTDARDACRLAHFHRSGDLTAVHVPDEDSESMRDLLRARNDAKFNQLKSRQRLSKFLLRHGRIWPKSNWTRAHHERLEQQRFDHPAGQFALSERLAELDEAIARIARFDTKLKELVPETPQADYITALHAFRGVQLLTAASIAFELGDFRRFSSPAKLMGYLGLRPSEDSSGDRTRRGGITKTGNSEVRRLLTETTWSYRHTPKIAYRHERRAAGVAPGVRRVAWDAQQRIHKKYRKRIRRGKCPQKTLTACARELAGFIWAAAHEAEFVVQPTTTRDA